MNQILIYIDGKSCQSIKNYIQKNSTSIITINDVIKMITDNKNAKELVTKLFPDVIIKNKINAERLIQKIKNTKNPLINASKPFIVNAARQQIAKIQNEIILLDLPLLDFDMINIANSAILIKPAIEKKKRVIEVLGKEYVCIINDISDKESTKSKIQNLIKKIKS